MPANAAWRSLDPDHAPRPVIAPQAKAHGNDHETPLHRHREGPLLPALRELSAGLSVQRVAAASGCESVTAFITMFKTALAQPRARHFGHTGAGTRRMKRPFHEAQACIGRLCHQSSQRLHKPASNSALSTPSSTILGSGSPGLRATRLVPVDCAQIWNSSSEAT